MIKKIIKENYKYLIILFILIVFFYILNKVNNFSIFYQMDTNIGNLIKESFCPQTGHNESSFGL